MDDAIAIDIVSDVVCPWCFLGAQNLKAALAALPDIAVDVRWRPFQLDSTIPVGGVDRAEYMAKKFTPERLAAAHDRLKDSGREAGIAFDFAAIRVAPNTLDAHRVIRWAAGAGVQDRVARTLFRAYFENGEDVGDAETLARIAGENGMDESLVSALLAAKADIPEVEAEIRTAQGMGITGVPCFIFDGRYAVMGAQPVEALVDSVRKIAAMKAEAKVAKTAS
ncbi:MAG: DsbA family protein [Phyllobacteriaceae bacterium]|nr:DsbA family protein [Phyllobacteriaceae bacterium]